MSGSAFLGELVDFYSGVGFPTEFQGIADGELPFAKVSDISNALQDGERTISTASNYIDNDVARRLRAKPFPKGTIVFAKIGEAIRKNRRAVSSREMLFDNNVMGIHAKAKTVDTNYLVRFLDTVDFYKLANSTAVPSLRKSVLSELRIPLPPLDEQKRIAAILDKADALRVKRRQAIALLDSLTQSIFREMFGDLTLWPTLKLAELTDEFRYGTSEKSQAVGHPTLRIPNVVGGSVSLSDLKFVPVNERELDRLRLQDGDILFVRTNGNKDYVGRSAVLTTKIESGTGYVLSDFIYASYLIRARVKQDVVNPHFLQAFLSGAAGRKMLLERAKTSAGQYNINTEGLGSINIPMPPMGKQEAFQSTIEKLSESLDACRLNLGQVDVLFASLQHRAFTGQL